MFDIKIGDKIQKGDYLIRGTEDGLFVAMYITDKIDAVAYQAQNTSYNPSSAMRGLTANIYTRNYQSADLLANKKKRMRSLVQEARKKAGWSAWKRNTTPMWWDANTRRTIDDEPLEVQALLPQLQSIVEERYGFDSSNQVIKL